MTLRSGEIYFAEQKEGILIPESISLFGLSVSFYGLFLVIASLVALWVIVREVRRKKLNTEWYLTLLTVSIVAALVGARLYYVIFQWNLFMQEPLSLLNFRSGGLSYFGALFSVWGVLKWICRKKKENFNQSADCLCIGAAAAAPFVWLGCLFVREPLGRFYEGWCAVRIGTEYLPESLSSTYSETLASNMQRMNGVMYVSTHPVALYGMVLSIVIFVLLVLYKQKAKTDGLVFVVYLSAYSVMMVVLEFFRADRCYIWGTKIPVNYIVAGVLILIVGIGAVRQVYLKRKHKSNLRFIWKR
ncbi:MAG: prolipoprotein diacylglyceryl transferase [Lachnospiraceae bacterium]|nr:prolipoprotein diacylglyceryl transferase [Lachnospiraceae bacterium]